MRQIERLNGSEINQDQRLAPVALVGVFAVVVAVRFPSYSLGTRDVRLADVFRILKQGLDFFLYNASVFG